MAIDDSDAADDRPDEDVRVTSTPSTDDRCDSLFAPLLGDIDRLGLSVRQGAAYGVWPNFRLAYLNRSWFRFAITNGADEAFFQRWTLGATILEAFPRMIRDRAIRFYQRVLRSREPRSFQYACSSSELQRRYRQITYPLGNGEGLLILNTLLSEQPQSGVAMPAEPQRYVRGDGAIAQCCHCRKAHSVETKQWDWVPQWVRQRPESIDDVVCPECLQLWYGALL